MMEAKIAHLGFIQGVITRMGNNSFLLKGWTITLVAALFVVSQKDSSIMVAGIAYFPCVLFWMLDSYYLWQERWFRQVYKAASKADQDTIDFSMAFPTFSKDECKKLELQYAQSLFSKTIAPFYIVVALSILATLIAINH